MPLKKVKIGSNMYQGWITHTHSHLGGECSHKCIYCYVENKRFGRTPRYTGPICLVEKEFETNYGWGKTIFIEHMNDLFAETVPTEFIERVLKHCSDWPENTYVFQTKNPNRYLAGWDWPKNFILGTTLETNRPMTGISDAPSAEDRVTSMCLLPENVSRFVTMEPILDFDVSEFARMIASMKPFFVNLGADSKGNDLPEPTVEKVMLLVDALADYGIELREKENLERLKP
ncbi:MAG: DUF5131 family protein [Candidatus Cloacimonetes bacterium]|jgi:DNA repair photolyase|nr:DUF5131 family protein [Candidatus Cloacimonadota bacterium]